MINLINTFCEEHKSADIWNNSPFKGVKELTNDHRGKLGEIIISQVFHYLNCFLGPQTTFQPPSLLYHCI